MKYLNERRLKRRMNRKSGINLRKFDMALEYSGKKITHISKEVFGYETYISNMKQKTYDPYISELMLISDYLSFDMEKMIYVTLTDIRHNMKFKYPHQIKEYLSKMMDEKGYTIRSLHREICSSYQLVEFERIKLLISEDSLFPYDERYSVLWDISRILNISFLSLIPDDHQYLFKNKPQNKYIEEEKTMNNNSLFPANAQIISLDTGKTNSGGMYITIRQNQNKIFISSELREAYDIDHAVQFAYDTDEKLLYMAVIKKNDDVPGPHLYPDSRGDISSRGLIMHITKNVKLKDKSTRFPLFNSEVDDNKCLLIFKLKDTQ